MLDSYPYERFGETRPPPPSLATSVAGGEAPSFNLLNGEERERLTRVCIIWGMMHDVDPNVVRPYAKLLIKNRKERRHNNGQSYEIQETFRRAIGWDEYPRAKGRLISTLKQERLIVHVGYT